MKKGVLSFFAAMCVVTFGTTVRDARAAGAKYDVCHAPPGNPAAAFTISVGSNAALAAHLAHGDTQGACNSGPTCTVVCENAYQTCLLGAGGDLDLERVCLNEFAGCTSACAAAGLP